jgi:hypothetical protein
MGARAVVPTSGRRKRVRRYSTAIPAIALRDRANVKVCYRRFSAGGAVVAE